MKSKLKIIPVGGVGQIGSNMTLINGENDIILIDAGILFPYEDFFDIDYLIPNLEHIPTPSHLIITHGHEDHIGAVIHVVKKFPNIQIHASPFCASLIRKKFDFNHIKHSINIYHHHDHLVFKDFTIDPIHVNHSIPETVGLLIKDSQELFSIFFISDFKIDNRTPYERPFDFAKLERLSKNIKNRILLVDSTNITSQQKATPSEVDVLPVMEDIISRHTDRVFVTSFSSNIHRLMSIFNIAQKCQRKVVPHGRSMISYLNTANELGMIPDFQNIMRPADSVNPNDKNIIVLLSGCQGDFRGTFRRFCIGEDSTFKPKADDLVILSSKAIPGNEKKISMLLNKVAEVGCQIVTSQDALVHVSGHPGRDDLLVLFNQYKPHNIIPIHGESYFIKKHLDFIQHNFPSAVGHYLLNHDELNIDSNGKISIVQGEKFDPVIMHGKGIILEREHISERRKLACNGVIFLSIKLQNFKASNFTLDIQGLPSFLVKENDKTQKFITNTLAQMNFKDLEKSTEEIRLSLRRYFEQQLGYKPITMVHLL